MIDKLCSCGHPRSGHERCACGHLAGMHDGMCTAYKKLPDGLERCSCLGFRVLDAPAESAHDAVDHPKHYTSHPSGVECIDVVEHMPFNLGNAVKYIWRAGMKGDAVEDLKKARWYIDRQIKLVSK